MYKPLIFTQQLISRLTEFVLPLCQNSKHSIHVNSFGPELTQAINSELAINGLPSFRSSIIFKRHTIRGPDPQCAHVDGNGIDLTHCSVVVPIQGCEDTALCWFDGDYKLVPGRFRDSEGISTQWDIQWLGPARLTHAVGIVDQPYLCRVDVPHDFHRNLTVPRITLTFRLAGNPLFPKS
jgi:hypothetical protein